MDNAADNNNSAISSLGLSGEALDEARKTLTAKGGSIVEILVQKKAAQELELLHALSRDTGIPFWPELPEEDLSGDFTGRVPIQYLRRYKVLPLKLPEGTVIAVNDPSNFQPVDDLRHLLGIEGVPLILSTQQAILSAINRAYDRSSGAAEDFIQDMADESADSIISEIDGTADLLDDTSDAPIIRLVNLMFAQAVRDRASDIHIEPYQNALAVRYRIDGVLYNTMRLPKRIQSSLISRVKIMAKMNIAEKRLPQDGRIDIKIGDKLVDIRVSTIPIAFGERIVLRLLDKSTRMFSLSELGLDEKNLDLLDSLIKSPYGIILVTGPTGSGKTTTLYAALSTINNPDINIITIEDPIEYQIEGIGQIQVNPKIDLTFAMGLRSIVRQDPDVILVGEIRDRETAEIAIQSSLTGHLVFSTLHTNDAASAVTRIIDMGIEPFLVSSSVIAIIAQRLVRVLCSDCKESYVPDDASLAKVGIERAQLRDNRVYHQKGCQACMHTGYRGRSAIFEMMVMDDNLKKLVLKTSDANQIRKEAVQAGMLTLMRDGTQKVIEGTTNIEEIFRVTRM
ncbi:MAG: type II secretion system ATPase GspE [Deltaproteobacteria bacterium]|nr:type II secretion system ATPase GspE [Deltaproteobacteria bacterium]